MPVHSALGAPTHQPAPCPSGSITVDKQVTLTVNAAPAPTFTTAVNTTSQTVTQGQSIGYTLCAVGPLLAKANQNLNAPTSSYDAIMVLGFAVTQMVGGGKFTPLNSYLKKVPAGFWVASATR